MESQRSDLFDLLSANDVAGLQSRLAGTLGRTQFCGFGEWGEPRSVEVSSEGYEPNLFWSNAEAIYGLRAPDYLAALGEIFRAEDPVTWLERRRWISQRRSAFFLSQQPNGLAESRSWFHLRRDFGKPAYHEAVVVPVPAPGVQVRYLVFGSSEPIRQEQAALVVAAGTIYAAKLLDLDPARRQTVAPRPDSREKTEGLKPRELEVIRWVVAGKSLQDVSAITGLAFPTVRYHLNQARKRYGYATTQQTVVRAALDYELDPLGLSDPF